MIILKILDCVCPALRIKRRHNTDDLNIILLFTIPSIICKELDLFSALLSERSNKISTKCTIYRVSNDMAGIKMPAHCGNVMEFGKNIFHQPKI